MLLVNSVAFYFLLILAKYCHELLNKFHLSKTILLIVPSFCKISPISHHILSECHLIIIVQRSDEWSRDRQTGNGQRLPSGDVLLQPESQRIEEIVSVNWDWLVGERWCVSEFINVSIASIAKKKQEWNQYHPWEQKQKVSNSNTYS